MDQVQMNVNEGDGPQHPIHLLPSELRGAIFNKLEEKDVSKVRLVCKQWAKEALDYYNYAITLNEDSSGLQFILQLRIISLRIKKLFGDRMQIYPNSDHEASDKLTLMYPDLIRHIMSCYGTQICISPPYLQDLIKLCQKKLTVLYCTSCCTPWSDERTFPPPTKPLVPFDLPNLKYCDLMLGFNQRLSEWNTVLWSQIVNSSLPKVQEIKVALGIWEWGHVPVHQMPKILKDIVKLITKNPDGLEKLTIRIIQGKETQESLRVPPQELSREESVALKRIRNIRKIYISNNHQLNYVYSQMFINLIGRQEQMEELHLEMLMMSADSMKHLTLNIFETIVKLEVHNLVVNAENPLDLAIFNNCSKLKKLSLERDRDYPKALPSLRPELINLNRLPATLLELELGGMDIWSTDILVILLSSDHFTALKSLHLDEVGYSGDLGINSAVFERIEGLESRTLDKVSLWNGERTLDCEIEVAKRTEVLKRLGISPQHYNFKFIRDETNRLRLKTAY